MNSQPVLASPSASLLTDLAEQHLLGPRLAGRYGCLSCLPLDEMPPELAAAYYTFVGSVFQRSGYVQAGLSFAETLQAEDAALRQTGHHILILLLRSSDQKVMYGLTRFVVGAQPPLLKLLNKLEGYAVRPRAGAPARPPYAFLELCAPATPSAPTLKQWLGLPAGGLIVEMSKLASAEFADPPQPVSVKASAEFAECIARLIAQLSRRQPVILGTSPAHARLAGRAFQLVERHGVKSQLISVTGIGAALGVVDPAYKMLPYHQLVDRLDAGFPPGFIVVATLAHAD